MTMPLRIGLIGYGGIGRSVIEALSSSADVAFTVAAILSRSMPSDAAGPVVDSIDGLLATAPDVVVECAGHGAVIAYGEAVLAAGIPMMLVSIGALADPALLARLGEAASRGNARLILAAGAMAGIEALAAAKLGGLDKVRYTGRKPPRAWIGTPAEGLVDLDSIRTPTTIYEGNAREAALLYPKNSNVAATVALAGIGFDRTEVGLVADPGVTSNIHELHFEGADGTFQVSIDGKPSRSNPKTSALTAHSIARLIGGLAQPIVI
jgi:aspartate dehydrogenase